MTEVSLSLMSISFPTWQEESSEAFDQKISW